MRWLWIGFKVTLSAALLAVAGLMVVLLIARPTDFAILGVAGLFLFFPAVLWVDFSKPSREFGLAGVVLSLGLLLASAQIFSDGKAHPITCTRRRLWCLLENALYDLGGPALAAAPLFLAGALLLYGSIRLVARRRQRS